jgi:hypothetical protein
MAIVIRSEKKLLEINNETGKIGPGEYFQDEIPIDKELEENLFPFNSSTKKTNLNIKKDNNKEIGPGYYYKNSSFIKNSFSTKSNNNNINFLNYALNELMNRRKDKEKLSNNETIINNTTKIKLENITNYNEYLKTKCENLIKKKNIIILPTTKTKMRVNSIPFKNDSFGYEIDNNGNVIIANKPNENYYNITFNINDKFGKKLKNKIKCIDWSKMSSRNMSFQKTNDYNNSNNTNNNNKKSNHSISAPNEKNEKEIEIDNVNTTNTSENKSKNNIRKNLKHSYSMCEILSKNLKSRLSNKNENYLNKNKENFIYENLFNVQPGPGYYYNDNDYEKYINPKIKLKDGFGSTEKKNKYYNNNNINLGPGSYFKTKYPIKKPNFYPLSEKTNKLNLLQNNNNDIINNKCFIPEINKNVGPGSYDIKSEFDKIKKSNFSGSNEKRFNYKIINDNPGPGKYIQLNEWAKKEEKIHLKEILNNFKEKIKEEKNNKNNSIIPGVGYYNPQIISSIGYKILSKENKIQSIIAPFNSCQERFLNKSHSSNNIFVGPGSYNNNISSFNIKVNNSIFNNNQSKLLKEKNSIQNNIGPGSYHQFNYNDWNKKSFNVLFV